MKKASAILLAFMLLVTQSGFVLSIHWCGNKIAGIGIVLHAQQKCSCGKKMKKSKCCKNTTVVLKTKDIQQITGKALLQVPNPKFELLINEVPPIQAISGVVHCDDHNLFHPPQIIPEIGIHLMNGVLTI